MTIIREDFVSAPAISPIPAGILTVAHVTESNHLGWRNEEGLYPSYNCLDTNVPTTICRDPQADPKDFVESDWAPGFNFSVYGGTKCRLVGFDAENAKGELTRVYLANESKGIEKALIGTRFVESDPSGIWDEAVDITPAGGAGLGLGLALAESYAGQHYAGVPTIHLPRTAASILAGANYLVRDNDRLLTRLDSKVVNGSGYEPSTGPNGAAPAAGTTWIYVTGEVTIERGPLEIHEVPAWRDNEDFILVERSYRVAVDCFTAAINVSLSSIIDGGTP